MTITYIQFQPSDSAPFQFTATLDAVQYNVAVTYNIAGQRYYINIYDQQGALIVCKPMVSSPPGYDISLTAGYFTSTMVYRGVNQQIEISDVPVTYPSFGVLPSPYSLLDVNFILDQSFLG